MSANAVGMYCKTFRPDFPHLKVMLESFAAHNPENLQLTLSLPLADLPAFYSEFGSQVPNIQVLADEEYVEFNVKTLPGWYGQQICKLMSWRAIAADHYAVVDSDSYFIKDIHTVDLMPALGKKYVACGSSVRTVFDANNPALLEYLRADRLPIDLYPPVRNDTTPDFSTFQLVRFATEEQVDLQRRSEIIYKIFGAVKWYFYQPGQIFSRELLVEFRAMLAHNNLTIMEAISVAPWEYNWYGEFAAALKSNETFFRVSPVVHFADIAGIKFAEDCQVTEAELSQKFIWIQMAARHLNRFKF